MLGLCQRWALSAGCKGTHTRKPERMRLTSQLNGKRCTYCMCDIVLYQTRLYRLLLRITLLQPDLRKTLCFVNFFGMGQRFHDCPDDNVLFVVLFSIFLPSLQDFQVPLQSSGNLGSSILFLQAQSRRVSSSNNVCSFSSKSWMVLQQCHFMACIIGDNPSLEVRLTSTDGSSTRSNWLIRLRSSGLSPGLCSKHKGINHYVCIILYSG